MNSLYAQSSILSKINKVPRPRKFPGKKINMEPIPDKNTVNLLSFFLPIILSFVLMNFETSIELKKIATINEDPNTIERVKGK